MVGAVVLDEGQCGHVLLRFLWAQEWQGKGCALKRGTGPRVSSNRGPSTQHAALYTNMAVYEPVRASRKAKSSGASADATVLRPW